MVLSLSARESYPSTEIVLSRGLEPLPIVLFAFFFSCYCSRIETGRSFEVAVIWSSIQAPRSASCALLPLGSFGCRSESSVPVVAAVLTFFALDLSLIVLLLARAASWAS